MIKVNKGEFTINSFPDGTKHIKYNKETVKEVYMTWLYEGDYEMVNLMYMVNHFKSLGIEVNLIMPYIPNARMDRVHNPDTEVFTLKYFCKFINDLNFKQVIVFDPHSDVSVALLDRVVKLSLAGALRYAIAEASPDVIFFPDAGAMKRYSDIIKYVYEPYKVRLANVKMAYGNKVRDWDTGEIKGLEVVGEIPNGAKVLMIDDICSYGGTMYYSAKKLKELGAGDIEMYVSHCENSIVDPEKGKIFKEDGLINRVYTTDSILTVEHPKIKLVRRFAELEDIAVNKNMTMQKCIEHMFS